MFDDIWEQFFQCLMENDEIKQASNKLICGVIFLYILPTNSTNSEELIKSIIHSCSKQITHHYKLYYRIEFIRSEHDIFVFRHRFFVPNKKMFCCGNECVDCTRFRK